MSHCIRCGEELPSAGAECPKCKIAFDELVDDSTFIDEDDEDEEFEPAPLRSRAARWEKVLDASPVFAGQEDVPEPVVPEREHVVRAEPEREREPAAQPDDEQIDAPEPRAPIVIPAEAIGASPIVAPIRAPVIEPISAPVVEPISAPVIEPISEAVAIPVVTPVQCAASADETGEIFATGPSAHSGPANVTITPRFEFHSAPAEGSPVVHALFDLEPTGAPLVAGTEGPVAHVILALDLSASMNDPRKYPVLTRAIENMLSDLRHTDDGEVLISLVVFAYGAEILLRAQPASQLDARYVLELIDRSPLRFSRYTDIVGALTRSGRLAYDSHRAMPRVPVRIYVLTDGRPQDVEGARKQMALIRKIPVDVHGLAFGDDADLETLQDLIAGARGGTVKHVRSDTLSSAFERIAQVAHRIVAKRALLDIELKGGVVGGASYRFRPGRHAYGKHAFANGQFFHTDLGTLESGRRYSLLFQFRLPPTQHGETEIGRVTLRIPGEGGPVTFERLLCVARHPGTAPPDPDPVVVEARHVVEALGTGDPQAQLNALRARHRLYVEERRDPYIIELIDRAIEEMETKGSLDSMSNGERAALRSHTQSVVGTGA